LTVSPAVSLVGQSKRRTAIGRHALLEWVDGVKIGLERANERFLRCLSEASGGGRGDDRASAVRPRRALFASSGSMIVSPSTPSAAAYERVCDGSTHRPPRRTGALLQRYGPSLSGSGIHDTDATGRLLLRHTLRAAALPRGRATPVLQGACRLDLDDAVPHHSTPLPLRSKKWT
jgi:hypothetical protein